MHLVAAPTRGRPRWSKSLPTQAGVPSIVTATISQVSEDMRLRVITYLRSWLDVPPSLGSALADHPMGVEHVLPGSSQVELLVTSGGLIQ
jgi:hypothetical protein